MRLPRRTEFEYERIKAYDDWLPGVIEGVQLAENRPTGFLDKDGKAKYADQVRFKLLLAGHDWPHYTRWMSYSYNEKANLFKKYLLHLVEGAVPDMAFDMDALAGMKIKTMWSANGDFDNLEQIRPLEKKCPLVTPSDSAPPETDSASEDDVPF
jgi:hypothetical protein